MNKVNLIITIFAIFLIGLVAAEVSQVNKINYGIIEDGGSLTTTAEPITDVNAIGFICQNADCSQIAGTLWNGNVLNSGSSSEITVVYPTVLQNAGYGVFYYKEGYIPYEVKSDRAGSGNAPERINYLTRARSCEVPINNLTISHYGNKIVVNVTLDASVSSPLQNAGPLNYVPDSIAHLYAINSRIDFRFIGPENVNVVKEVNLPYSTTKIVSAEIEELSAGLYRIEAESSANDNKCLSSVNQLLHTNLLIEDNRTNATLPTISIISPEAKTYTNGNILVDLRNTSATSVWFNYGGANITYEGPTLIYFPDGTYTLDAYAKNNVTTAHHSVIFRVNTTLPNNDTDTTPPFSISNLNLVSRTKDSLVWSWTNPSDSDFSQTIIFVNGVNVLNTSANTYTSIGLSANTDYTITVHTKDVKGNVNRADVSLTSRTLSNDDDNNGGNNPPSGGSSSKKKAKVFNDTEPEAQPVTYGKNYESNPIRELKKSVSKDYSLLLYIMLIACSLVLLLILILLVAKSR